MGYLISCRFHYGQIFLQKSICTYCEEIFHWKCLIHKVHKTDFRQCWKLSAARKKNKLSPTFEGDFLMFSWAKLKSIYYSVRTKKLLDIKGTFFFLSKSFTNNFSKAIPQVLNPDCKSRETLMQVLLSPSVVWFLPCFRTVGHSASLSPRKQFLVLKWEEKRMFFDGHVWPQSKVTFRTRRVCYTVLTLICCRVCIHGR